MSGVSEAEKELEAMNDNDVMRQYVLAPMKSTSQNYKQKEDDILKNMPDSPSMSSIHVLTPKAHDTLILTSDAGRRRGWSKQKGRRESTEYELEEIEDEVVRYNDPPPHHPKKKYEGYVPQAVDRVDTTGKLPTPSQSQHDSFSDEQPTPAHHKATASQLEQVVSQHLEVFQQDQTHYLRPHKSTGLPPRPPPPSRGEQKDGNDDEDNQYYDEHDDDLKEPFIEIDTDTMGYDVEFETRVRGVSNGSGSEVGSLNSVDSSDSMSELSKSRQVPRKPMVEVGYASNAPIHSESRSNDVVPPVIETSIDKQEKSKEKKKEEKEKEIEHSSSKENDKSKNKVVKKKKKKKMKA
eukprot:291170_1